MFYTKAILIITKRLDFMKDLADSLVKCIGDKRKTSKYKIKKEIKLNVRLVLGI